MIFEELLKEERSEGKTEGRIEGRIEATAEAILELLEVLGPVPGHLSSVICSETDLELLKKWHRLAARSTSVQQFINNMYIKISYLFSILSKRQALGDSPFACHQWNLISLPNQASLT